MTAKKRQTESTRRKRVPQVFIEPTPVTQAPRFEQGHELINPKYKTNQFNKLLHYLATERRVLLYDPVEPKTTLDDELFPAFPVLFKDRWRSRWPEVSLRVELLKLQASNASAHFKDLLTDEEQEAVCTAVNDEMTRRGATAENLYHKSGVPTPCQEFPLDLFTRRGFPTADLWRQKNPFETTRIKPRPRRKKAPNWIEVVGAWQPFDLLPREILQGSNETQVTLKGYAFCQLIRRALSVDWDESYRPETNDAGHFARRVDWLDYRIEEYFHVPAVRTLRWYSWIAQPLFYLLEAGDDWAWKRFKALVDFLGWRRAEADLFRSWVTPPSVNIEYQSLKREILGGVGQTKRKDLREWFRRLEQQFVEDLLAFGGQAMRVHWLMKDSQFVIPYLLLYVYCKPDLKRYKQRVRTYLRNLKPLLQETAPAKPERFAYQVWEFETMCQHDPWYSICLNWEFWVGSEEMLRAVFTPLKSKGAPLGFEVKRLISGCLPLFGELSKLHLRSRTRRGMEIYNALSSENIYPPGSEHTFDRDVRRAQQKQAK